MWIFVCFFSFFIVQLVSTIYFISNKIICSKWLYGLWWVFFAMLSLLFMECLNALFCLHLFQSWYRYWRRTQMCGTENVFNLHRLAKWRKKLNTIIRKLHLWFFVSLFDLRMCVENTTIMIKGWKRLLVL